MDLEYDHMFVLTSKFDELLIKSMKQKYCQKIRVDNQISIPNVNVTYSYDIILTEIYYN